MTGTDKVALPLVSSNGSFSELKDPSSIDDHIFLAKPKQGNRYVENAFKDDSEFKKEKSKSPRIGKFGKILQRSISLIQPSSSDKQLINISAPSLSMSCSTLKSSIPPKYSANEESDNEDDITNAFIFSATETNEILPLLDKKFDDAIESKQKTIVKSVKVTRVHSQKTPHIQQAARRMSNRESEELQQSHKQSPVEMFSGQGLSLSNSPNLGSGLMLREANKEGVDLQLRYISDKSSCDDENSLNSTLPFRIDSEDLEVAEINSNAADLQFFNKETASSPATIQLHTQELAEFLKQSVTDLDALEDLDSIRSERFSFVNEELSTLDDRLLEEFATLELDSNWTLQGPYTADNHRETLLHFGARFGLTKFSKFMLELAGAQQLLYTPNRSGLLPEDVASNESHYELAKFFMKSRAWLGRHNSSSVCESSDVLEKPVSLRLNMEYSINKKSTSATPSATSLSLDAKIDMLHQLIEEMEIDGGGSSNPSHSADAAAAAACTTIEESTFTSMPVLSLHTSPLDMIPETAALQLTNLSNAAPTTASSDTRDSVNPSLSSASHQYLSSLDFKEDSDEEHSQASSLIKPYSETSSGSLTDNEEAPALPPRTWKNGGIASTPYRSISPISVDVGVSSPLDIRQRNWVDPVPCITVSPPQAKVHCIINDSVQLARECRVEVENMSQASSNNSASIKRFSTSCPSLENQALYDMYQGGLSHVVPISTRPPKGQYKSLLDVTHEENEEEVNAAISESPLVNRRSNGERPKSLDFSTLGDTLSIAGVTIATSSTDHLTDEGFADKNRKVSFNMFGGAQKEKSRFHQGVATAGHRSFSLGSLASEDDEDEQRSRIRDRSADSDGHVKPIDIYGAPLQKLPNVDFSKHIGLQSDGSTSSLQSTSREQLDQPASVSSVTLRHSTHARSALPLPQNHTSRHTTSNLSKSLSVSTPSINQIGEQHGATHRHSNLYPSHHSKLHHNTDSLPRSGLRRPLSQEQDNSLGPSNYDNDDRKSKKGGRRTSVFAKFGSVRKTSKAKERDRDVKRTSHNFISVTLSNSACNHCSKLLNYKPSVQCSNCLMNYHDECKDKVPTCPKQKTRERKSPVVPALTSQISRHELGEGFMSPSIGDSYSPSMESLVDDGNADDEFEDDPELSVKGHESESWSETIDKKVLKNQKAKYIQRQDNIWELIATERQYCVNLKIMQKVFATGMRSECTLPDSAINRIFPELDELIDLHQAFLASLLNRQDKKPDKSIDHIGDILIQHFGGPTGERMKKSYGIFCSRHKEGIDYYKQLYKADRKFQAFIKRVSSMAYTKRRGVQDFVTVVTMRMTKYRTLIENIIKNTKDSKDKNDKENLNKALDLNKDILRHIDTSIHDRNQEIRLVEIYNKMDARSTATYDKIKKFKKSDLTAKGRKLRYEGVLSWRNAREKEVEMLVVVLSDVILCLQETDKKYSFFAQDNKASVIPLSNLIVREKGSTKDNRGIYLIRQSRENPEMYELVCKSSQERKEWIDLLRKAVNESPEEDEGVINETEEEHREVIGKLGRLREYVELLEYKDKELEKFCRDRFSIVADIMQVYDYADVLQNIKSCYDDDGELRCASELVRLAIEEASVLASLYQTLPSSTNLGRSWSSVGERQSPTYQQVPLPKRAETFNGFDQDQVKSPSASTRSAVDKGDSEGRTPSLLNLHQDSDCEGGAEASIRETSKSVTVNRRSSSNILQQFLPTSSRHEEVDSGNGSLLAMSNMLAITSILPPTQEQAQSVTQLNEYLHGILLAVNKQDSTLEHIKYQLADLTVRSRKIEQDQEKKSLLRHNKQMEEIRNRHEQLTKERELLENEKENLNTKLENERAEIEAVKTEMANQQNELKKEREELQRQREALQKQIDFYQVKGCSGVEPAVNSPSLSPNGTPYSSTNDLHSSSLTSTESSKNNDVEISHRRSHSAELVDCVDFVPQMFVDARYSASLTEPLNLKEARAQQFGYSSLSPERQIRTNSSNTLTKTDHTSSLGSLKRNSNNNTVQQTASKLVTSSSSKTATKHTKSMFPLNLAESSKKLNKDQTQKASSQNKKGDVIYC